MSQDSLIEFPCHFPIKVMGETSDEFANTILNVVKMHDASFDASRIEMTGSRTGKYLSLTCSVWVSSQTQLDAIYRSLTSHPLVKFVI
jgi:uncharacterized protein